MEANRALRAQFLLTLFDRYIDEDLADPEFTNELALGDANVHVQRISELLLAGWLWRKGFTIRKPDGGHGPDFHVVRRGRSAWVELVTPSPTGIDPIDLTLPEAGEVRDARSVPHRERLLRWTAALSAKASQLARHQAAGIVKPGDAYVIAVNARQLDPFWQDMTGLSGYPAPLEVAFGLGPRAFEIVLGGTRPAQSMTTFRPVVPNSNGADVCTQAFAEPAYRDVSAIWGLALHDFFPFGRIYPSVVVHNPNAPTRIRVGWLPAEQHWTGKYAGTEIRLRRHHPPRRKQHAIAAHKKDRMPSNGK